MQDIDTILSLEIKKEIADRYFGFRKLIEDDSRQYTDEVKQAFRQMEEHIGFDLIRLYILLREEPLVHDFFRLINLRDDIFFDPYLLQSPTVRKKLFAGMRPRGLTRRARFHHLFMDIYSRLKVCIDDYRTTLKRLIEEQQTISSQIDLFYRKNDLSAMMGFMRGLDANASHGSGMMAGDIAPLRDDQLAEKMAMAPPPPAEKLLPVFSELPPLKSCRARLEKLIDLAYERQGHPDVRTFAGL